jgi:hypothetical protein
LNKMKMKQVLGLWLAITVNVLGQTINYQGRLTDKAGQVVNDSLDFEVKLYSSNDLSDTVYVEKFTDVVVKDGLYSLTFGLNGTSTVKSYQTLGFSNGEDKVFTKIVNYAPNNLPIKILTPDYQWSESGDGNTPSQFIGSINRQDKSITGIFIGEAPAFGQTVTALYYHDIPGLDPALDQNPILFIKIWINGEALSSVEKFANPKLEYPSVTLPRLERPLVYRDTSYRFNEMGFLPLFDSIHPAGKMRIPVLYDHWQTGFDGYVKFSNSGWAPKAFNIWAEGRGNLSVSLLKYSKTTGEKVVVEEFVCMQSKVSHDGSIFSHYANIDPSEFESYDFWYHIKPSGGNWQSPMAINPYYSLK